MNQSNGVLSCVGESFINSYDCTFCLSFIHLYQLGICYIEDKSVCIVPNQLNKIAVKIHKYSSDLTEKLLISESGGEFCTYFDNGPVISC